MTNSSTVRKKSPSKQKLINEALELLASVGIPLEKLTDRGRERMAMCFLAVADVRRDWRLAKSTDDNAYKTTRDIITIINERFGEKISSGSYDDIRRKDLSLPVLAGLIINSAGKNGSATNDPTRGYALHPDFKNLIVKYNTREWTEALSEFKKNHSDLSAELSRTRTIDQIPVILPDGIRLDLSLGEHNALQKAVIEEFLPRFGGGCSVLYVGDTSKKMLHIQTTELQRLKFFDLEHNKLPDVIAYNKKGNRLFLIEAVHSAGPMSETRVLELKRMLKDCTAEVIFVTAFLSKDAFRRWSLNIAWETEAWIADNPDHLVHFNGHKFLAPMTQPRKRASKSRKGKK